MRIQSITTNIIRKHFNDNAKSFIQNTSDNMSEQLSDKINFGVGEDYITDLDAPENPNSSSKPGFKRGLLGIATILTFPISVPAMMIYEHYKDKHKNDIKTNMNYDNIEP